MSIFAFSIPEDEKTLLIVKAHWSSYLATWLKIVFGIAILALILTFALPGWWDNRWGRIGIIIGAAAALIFVVIDFWNRFLTTYIITQCRLVDITQEKFFRRVITEIDLDEVEEVIIKQTSWWNQLFSTGHAIVKLKDEKGVLVYYDVFKPERVREILEGMQQETSEIIEKKGKECDVILKDDREHKVSLSYSYYGEKAKHKKNGGLIIVKKNAKKTP
jgi:hypothetical protein